MYGYTGEPELDRDAANVVVKIAIWWVMVRLSMPAKSLTRLTSGKHWFDVGMTPRR